MGETDPAIVEEAGEGIPALGHIVAGIAQAIVARKLADLIDEPDVQIGHEWCTEFLTDGKPLDAALAVAAAPDVQQGIGALYGFARDRIDHAAAPTTVLLAG